MRDIEQEAQLAGDEAIRADCRVTELLLAQPLNHLVKLEFKAHVPLPASRPTRENGTALPIAALTTGAIL